MISRIPSKVLSSRRPCRDRWPSRYRVDTCSMPFSKITMLSMPNRMVSATKGRRSPLVSTRIPAIIATTEKTSKSLRPVRCKFRRKPMIPEINQKRPMALKSIGCVLSVINNAIPSVMSITPRMAISPMFNALGLDWSVVLSLKSDHCELVYYFVATSYSIVSVRL